MALGGKTSKKFFVTSGGGSDEINAARKAIIDGAFDADLAKGNVQLIDDQTFGPLIFNIQRMQDDLDEVRRFIGANEPKVGSTFDATTDFTVGSTVITDGTITLTPTTGDTAEFRASANGALGITTTDAATAAANITITADGTAELAGTTVTLDSGGNIELETGAVTNYVNTDGLYRGGNIGDIQYVSSVYYVPITATDFQGHADNRGGDAWGMEGANGGEWASHGRAPGFIEKVIPLGFTATSCVIYGDTGTNTFEPFESALNASTVTSRGSATAIGSTCTFSSNVVGDGTKTVSIKLIVGEARDFFFGGKLILIKT